MSTDSEQVSMNELGRLIWNGRLLIASMTSLIVIAAATAAYVIPKRYTAVAVVTPAQGGTGGGLGAIGALASRFGGLASLAGISVPSDSGSAEAMATLQSDGLTIEFIREKNLLPILFEKEWNATSAQWKEKKAPTLWKGNQYFNKKVRAVNQDKDSGMVYVSVTWTDPRLAADWANELIKATNDRLRAKTIAESERNIQYLNEQASKTNVLELRATLFSLMESELQKSMVARGSNEFALKVIDAALPPEKPSFPRPSVWIAAGLIGGLFLSMLLVVVRGSLRRD